VTTPDDVGWVDRDAYPFRSRHLDLPAGRMHYVDEGQGEPVVMVHGTPDWSFLWRHLIRCLAPGYRCVAMDHIGFGLSDKPASFGYRPEDHAENVRALIEHLGLRDLTLAVHDFGVPIGLAYAIARPDAVRRIVLLNGWCWSLEGDRRIRRIMRVMTSPLGWLLYTRLNFSVRVIMKQAFGDKAKLPPSVHRQYIAPFPTSCHRQGPWGMAKGILGSSAWYESLWARRDRIVGKPTLVLWGLKDPAFGRDYLARWRSVLTDAEVVTLPAAGHFPQEEEPDEICRSVTAFLRRPLASRA
jgi:pimeloyl-ACP methyl ester carboxylesterase